MAAKVPTPRDISPWLQKFRAFLLGREHLNNQRFSKDVFTRSPPEANLPPGPAHKDAFNYYFTRDARREVTFPKNLADNTLESAKALQSGQEGATVATTGAKRKTPGPVYRYSQ